MLNKSLTKAICEQINLEYSSAYIYLAMSAYCDRMSLKGFANWLNVQSQEEMAHAGHMYNYLLDRGATPVFEDIKSPSQSFNNVIDVFEKVLEHEQFITKKINKLATLAMQETDHAAYGFMQWFVNEQIEEESTTDLVLQKLKLIGDHTSLILSLDAEMGQRMFVDPFASMK